MRTREIERRFLVRNDDWRRKAVAASELRQGYLLCDAHKSLRIRLVDGRAAFLTVKFKRQGIVRDEFEYAIPLLEAEELLERAIGAVIEKSRYRVPAGKFTWEIDVFHGAHSGLTIAEIELFSETDRPVLPRWLGPEITGDARYSNRTLATMILDRSAQLRLFGAKSAMITDEVSDSIRRLSSNYGPD
ncbi:CYTH domain-containing protein [Rhizobium sp. CNPSo 3464]|uniref:CYTH domain-containing protein n=1 Tax=Rhizobium sp. CNPSo 3464 TaxID=3021406 RepID=UPI0025519348|nr:CYTH domain-containing protein [Rhizobium sp. CNPSo 3464]MDK4743088.1 CYTH domain-containing protein [Rhizobium sp. CNPSo 3464]